MQTQPGDIYLRHLAKFIRDNDKGLAESGFFRRRKPNRTEPLSPYPFLPLAWLSPSLSPPPAKPVLLSIDTHHLFYVLMRLEALGIQAGPLDVQVESPSRPMSYANIYTDHKDPETLSLASFRSSLSIVSNLSLAGSLWFRPEPPNIDAELKYIYSSFTKLPALAITAPGKNAIAELSGDSLERNAVPLDVFKNLQRLECENIDPRILLGWDLLAVSLKSIKIRKSGLEDITQVFIGAVLDDQARRQGSSSRRRNTTLESIPSTLPPISVESGESASTPTPLPQRRLSPAHWASLKHMYLPENNLTSFPAELLSFLTSITHLDLSSNLLVSVPPGLEELYNLTSLNLADNIIDSVLGIYLNLGQLIYLNLSHNRLESLCGLERLLSLERIDLRHNILEESSEIGRLVVLPNISELWVDGNPFAEIEESYRINCFNYFWKEGKTIILDGTPPTMFEKRSLSPSEQSQAILPPSSSAAPIIAIEPSYNQVFMAPPQPRRKAETTSKKSPSSTGDTESVVISGRRPKQKKAKRIVNLDGTIGDHLFSSAPHSRLGSVQISHQQNASSTSHQAPATVNEPGEMIADEMSPTTSYAEGSNEAPPFRRSRHSRNQTEYAPSPLPEDSSKHEFSGPSSLSRSEARRARMSASVFEPALARSNEEEARDVDAYRRTIESLKKDMGDSWLKVYNQTQA